MAKSHGASIKDDDTYEALRERGASKEKAARIANAQAAGGEASERGGESRPYEDWTRDALYERAKELNIDDRSSMDKSQLIDALRSR